MSRAAAMALDERAIAAFLYAMTKQQCEFEGCRSWARRGTPYCVAHPDGLPRSKHGGSQEGTQYARTQGLYAAYVPVVDLKSALRLPPGDLRLEIAVVRQVLAQLLAAELPPAELVAAVDKATSALVRMLKANKQLSEDAAGELETAVDRYLSDLGLGRGGV
jgi:hypothetical protein